MMLNRYLTPKFLKLGTLILLFLICILYLCSNKISNQPKPDANPVEIVQVKKQDMPFVIQLSGTLEPYETVTIKSQVNGTLLKKHFTDGQRVKTGDLLFEIDDREFKQQLEQAEATYARDQALYVNADKEEQRYKELLKKNFTSQEQYAQILANRDSLSQTIEGDKAAIELANLQIDYCQISAPTEGIVGEVTFHEGDLIQSQNSSLVVINKISPIYVSFFLAEDYLNDLKIARQNNTLEVKIEDDEHRRVSNGEIDFIDNTIDANTGTIKVKAIINNNDEIFWPGEFVRVLLNIYDKKDALVIPVKSVETNQDGQYVFVVGLDNKVSIRNIRVDFSNEEFSVISSGLELGETVVTSGQLRLYEGAVVVPYHSVKSIKNE